MSLQDQLALERDMLSLGKERFMKSVDDQEDEFNSAYIQRIAKLIILPFAATIEFHHKNEVENYYRGKKPPLMRLMTRRAYLNMRSKKQLITFEQLSYITTRFLLLSVRGENMRVAKLASEIGEAVNQNLIIEERLSKNESFRIGGGLVEMFVDQFPFLMTKKLDFVSRESKNKEYHLAPTSELTKLIDDSIDEIAEMSNVVYPMVFRPCQWNGDGKNGGFFSNPLKRNIVKKYAVDAPSFINDEIAGAINAIQESPWCVNLDILSLMESLESTSPPSLKKVYPAEPVVNFAKQSPYPDIAYADLDDDQKVEHQDYMRKRRKYEKSKLAKDSIESSRKCALQQANMFADREEIYFPHDVDYRMRTYNICMTGLNTQGSDFQKGLVKFQSNRPVVTEDGVKWMKINMANLAGNDKLKLDERVKWTNENEDLIREVVANPLGCDLWHGWDKPMQGMAAAVEYVKWLDDNGAKLNTHVQLDGLCNGVQHLSAITRDELTAPHVGLIWTEKRGDVYQHVCNSVMDALPSDDEMTDIWMASGLLDRSLTKTPVMTRSYGAKLYGIKEGVQEYIDEKNPSHFKDVFMAGNWMGAKIWEGMDSSLKRPMAFMNWVQTVAGMMATMNKPLIWENPMGMLCKQSPMVTKKTPIKMMLNGRRTEYCLRTPTKQVSKSKMESSSSPNLIHGNDGGHLGLTVNLSKQRGVQAFAMVHDSFGSHPDDASTLLKSAKDSWVDIYQNNWMEIWYQRWVKVCPNIPHWSEYIDIGTLKVEEVMKSDFFFA